MARHFDTIARLWDHLGDKGIGFCLDTCHAWAADAPVICETSEEGRRDDIAFLRENV